MLVLALDALDPTVVEKYDCRNLMQTEHGRTDLSDFKLERTVVLWASFLTGKNMESKIPIETQWEFKLRAEDTFLSDFGTYNTIDVPAFSLKEKNHSEERSLLKKYFDREATVEQYDATVWKNHEENKKDFFDSIGRFDMVIGYFDLADAIGHLSFGIPEKMKRVYLELERTAQEARSASDEFVLIVSDHGMRQVGRYGDHNREGFYSTNRKIGLDYPRITDFNGTIKKVHLDGSA